MKKKILDGLKKAFGEDYEFSEHEVKKNNGLVLHGICVRKKGDSIAPQIYIDDVPEDEVVDFVVRKYKAATKDMEMKKKMEAKLKDMLDSPSKLLEHVFPVLINREKNEEYLNDVVHTPFLDMEIIYKINVGDGAFVTVSNKLAESTDITNDDLHDSAVANIQSKAEKYSFGDLIHVHEDEDGPKMFIVSNKEKTLGAGMILDNTMIECLSEKLGDFYVIPSSIHEMIVVPSDLGEPDALINMIRSVNETLEEAEILSDNVYVCKEGKLEIA